MTTRVVPQLWYDKLCDAIDAALDKPTKNVKFLDAVRDVQIVPGGLMIEADLQWASKTLQLRGKK
jgi:hypothetical protein